MNEVRDSTYEIRININNINTNVKNSRIYKSGVIIKQVLLKSPKILVIEKGGVIILKVKYNEEEKKGVLKQ